MNPSSRWYRRNKGVSEGRKAGGNFKSAADGHTQKSSLSGDGNVGSNCNGNVVGNTDGYVDDDGGGRKRKWTKIGNVNGDSNVDGNVNAAAAVDRVVTAAERQQSNKEGGRNGNSVGDSGVDDDG